MTEGSPCTHHRHPQADHPVTKGQFKSELRATLHAAGIHKPFTLRFAPHVSARHDNDERAYAEVNTEDLLFNFADQARWLPDENRHALIAHEVGHVLDPYATENGADRAAERALGIRIVYDRRWPGKGLQVLGSGALANPAPPPRDSACNPSGPAPRDHEFWATCEMLSGQPRAYSVMQYITSHQKPITYQTFARKADLSYLREMDHPSLYRLSSPSNWSVSFHKSKTPSGIPVYYYRWSGIEHMFTPESVDMETEAAALPPLASSASSANPAAAELEADISQGHDGSWHYSIHQGDRMLSSGSGFMSSGLAKRQVLMDVGSYHWPDGVFTNFNVIKPAQKRSSPYRGHMEISGRRKSLKRRLLR